MSDSGKAVFLSYASQDAEAAKRICEALRAAGVEVWFDQSELVGGDAWDQKIRGQIKECALFMPVVSANTEARAEGYFRIEWRLADRRMEAMGKAKTFLLPVCIDDTRDSAADVPDSFSAVQWTRLPGGEPSPAFVGRVKKLLEGPATVAGVADPGRRAPASPRPATSNRRRWLAPVLGSVAVAVLAFALTRPWQKPGIPAASAAPAAPVGGPVAQVWKLLYQHGMARVQLDSADHLCRQAAAEHPTNPEVWAAWAHVHSWFLYHRFDESPERRQAAQDCATKARQLAPESYEARLAQAVYWLRGGAANAAQGQEAEQILRTLLAERPDDPRVRFFLGTQLLWTGDDRESGRKILERLGEDPALGSVAWMELGWTDYFTGRFDAAERAIDRSIAAGPYWNNVSLKILLALDWHGDPAAARVWLGKIPPVEMQEDFILYFDWLTALSSRNPQPAIVRLTNHPAEWLSSNAFQGPKHILLGDARRMAGQLVSAERDYRRALELIDARLKEDPNNAGILRLRVKALHRLGEGEAAAAAYRLYREIGVLGRLGPEVKVMLEPPDKVLDELEARFDAPTEWTTAASFRINPIFDPLRANPRFQALLARAEASPRHRPNLQGVGIAAVQAGPKSQTPNPGPASPPGADSKSVAVLAFANLSDDKGNEYFSDGISEELLNVLAKVPGLKVSARTSAFYFKGKEVPIPEIAQKLGVAYVVEGSVRKQGDKVRITAQLIKAADGFHIWSDTFTRDLKDIFAVQDEIAGLIAQQLQLKLTATDRAKRVVDPEAYRLVLEGRQFWNLRSEDGFTKAEAAFMKALAIDPQFAEAHAGLGGVCVIRAVYHELDDVPLKADDLERAVREGRRALEIDPSSADALAVLAYAQMMGNQLAESDRNFQQALVLNPNSALVHCWYALLLNAQGRLDASFRHYQKAAEIDPLWFINLHMMGSALAFAQRHDQALGILERAEALRTEIFLPNMSERARALLALGRKEEAFAAARQILHSPDLRPRWGSDAIAIRVLWAGGQRQEAEAEAARLFTRYPPESYLRGFILVALGRFNEALPFLSHTPSVMVRHIYWDTMWDSWRTDPRFIQLMTGMGRAEEYKVARATLARMQQEAAGK